MRLSLPIVSILAALLDCAVTCAQLAESPRAAYDHLPTASSQLTIVPPSPALQQPDSVVPPAQSVVTPTQAVVQASAAIEAEPLESSLTHVQPWTPGEVTCAQPVVGPSHSTCSEPWNGGWFGAVELTMLSPNYSLGSMTLDEDRTFVGPRLVFGWESDRGLGLRTRFWGLQNESPLLTSLSGPLTVELDASRFDFDVYRKFAFSGSNITVGASVTAAQFDADFESLVLLEEDGTGVGFFVEGRHLFYDSEAVEWAAISRGRWAGLIGQWHFEDNPGLTTGDSSTDIFEAALGLEFKRKFDCADFIVQYMLEGQRWAMTTAGDVGYLGSTLSIGFAR